MKLNEDGNFKDEVDCLEQVRNTIGTAADITQDTGDAATAVSGSPRSSHVALVHGRQSLVTHSLDLCLLQLISETRTTGSEEFM